MIVHVFLRRPLARVMVATALTMPALSTVAGAQDDRVDEIYRSLQQGFADISTLDVGTRRASVRGDVVPDLTWTYDTFRERAGKYANTVVQETTDYRVKGEMFRVNFPMGDGPPLELAYDGEHRQVFMLDSRTLSLSVNEPAYWKMADVYHLHSPAFLRPYDFVFYSLEVPSTLDSLRAEDVWQSLEKHSKYVGEDRILGERCAVVEIEVLDHSRNGIDRSRVYFVEDKQYFPIRYEHYIGDDVYEIFEATDLFRSIRNRHAPGTGHFFASRAVKQEFDWMGSGAPSGGQLWEIPRWRARWNADIPDAFFTIARSEALTVVDENGN